MTAPSSLAEALHRLQADPPAIVKAERAQAGNFSYSFAGLSAVTEAVLPVLNELGCIWVCRPTRAADGAPVLAYSLRHLASGEREDGEFPLLLPGNASPQVLGSLLSYTRRYALLAVTGIAPVEDDDDAAAASRHAYGEPSDRPRTTRARKASKAQVTAIQAGYGELGYGGDANRGARLSVSARLLGLDELGSHNDLTNDQAKRVLDGIAERKRRQVEEPSSLEGGRSSA